MAQNNVAMVESSEYKHEDACNLFNPRHQIPKEVAEVLDELNEMSGVRAVAGGCGTCAAHALHHDEETDWYVHYTAQTTADTVYFGYGTGEGVDTEAEAVAKLILDVCDQKDVSADWTGDTAQTVCIGDNSAYDE